ncbi:MAG: acyl transferase domain-containing protein, partial [Myxococcota bacterium]
MTSFSPIAIVGRAAVLPGALSVEALWEQVSRGADLTSDAPPDRWGIAPQDILCDDPDHAGDRTWSKRGGYVRGFEDIFDPEGFALSATEIQRLDPLFQWTLHTARAALQDAGITSGERVGAIFGNLSFPSAGLSRYAESQWLAEALSDDARERLGHPTVDPRNRFMSGLPALLLRRALSLTEPCFTLDAACASSLYAIKMACDQLHDGDADVMLAGAVNCSDDLFIHVGFCALSAMSRTGQSRPFHAGADGLVPAEGAAFVALKRLEDAERDGDTIHGVIRGVGLANDGRARGLLAPAEEGQIRAMQQAYEVSGVDPSEITLLECHATGTPVGDATEVRSSAAVFANNPGLPLGSLKSNTGHLITAAGTAGLIKVLGAMAAGVRPPTLHVEDPNPALSGTPFRLLTAAEPWEGRRIAGVSAFGFGGNNAHLIVEQYPLASTAELTAPRSRPEIAVVAIGIAAGSAGDHPSYVDAMRRGFAGHDRATAEITLDLKGMKFPPNDLKRALGQQLLMMAVADEALAQTSPLPRDTTGVRVGMGADPEVARYGARWRLSTWGRQLSADPSWVDAAREGFVPLLKAAGVLGTMPNIPANRLNSQFDLAGPSCVFSAEEHSGLVALQSAIRALQVGELDAALVGAVDLSVEPVHQAAAAVLLRPDQQTPGDAAVVLILKRLPDAHKAGDRIFAVLGGPGGPTLPEPAIGHAHAASGLLAVATAALSLHHRVDATGRPVTADRATVTVEAMEGNHQTWHLYRPTAAAPELVVYTGADRDGVLDALRADRRGGDGPARLVLVAESAGELSERTLRAERHLVGGAPAGEGVHFRASPVVGELAFMFTGAGLTYPGLGTELLAAIPELSDRLGFPHLTEALTVPDDPTPLEMLWGASALCQLHATLSRDILGLTPDAVIGYSSGETNALLAMGAWRDLDALYTDTHTSGLFSEALAGDFTAVASAWGVDQVDWSVWSVMVDEDELAPLLADEPRVHLAIRHTTGDLVIAGETARCQHILHALPGRRYRPLDYNLAVHVPELSAVSSDWLALHRRETFPVPGVRFYRTADATPYTPDTESAAQAIHAQALTTLDLTGVIERAWSDGVRVFVEHGPQAICASWIRRILGEREAVVVSLDRRGRGVRQVFEAVAALLAAGISVDVDALTARFVRATTPPPVPRPAPAIPLRFSAHPDPVSIPTLRIKKPHPRPVSTGAPIKPPIPAPRLAEAPMESTNGRQAMAPAPALPSAFDDAPVAPLPAPSTPVAAQPVAAQPVAAAPTSSDPMGPIYARHQAHVAQLAGMHQEFVAAQARLHQQFMQSRQNMMMALLHQQAQPATQPFVHARPAPESAQPVPAQPVPQQLVRATPVPAPVVRPSAPKPAVAAKPVVRPTPAKPAPRPVARPTPKPVAAKPAAPPRPGHTPGHTVPAHGPTPTGLTLNRQQLHTHSSGNISE